MVAHDVPIQRFSIALRDLRASGHRGKVLASGLEGGEEDRKRGLRIGTSAGEDIESEISVLGVSVERDVRLRQEEVAREATPWNRCSTGRPIGFIPPRRTALSRQSASSPASARRSEATS